MTIPMSGHNPYIHPYNPYTQPIYIYIYICIYNYVYVDVYVYENKVLTAALGGGGVDVMVKTMRKVVFSPPYLSLRGLYWLNPNLHNMAVVQELKPPICVSSTKHFNVPFYLMSEIILDRKLRAYFTGSPSRVPRVPCPTYFFGWKPARSCWHRLFTS